MSTIVTLFILLLVYQLKHFLADYILQGEYMLGKFKPGWDFLKPLLAHVGYHALYTMMIANATLEWLGFRHVHGYPVFVWSMLIGLFDGFVHFFMDRIKAGPKYMGRWKPVTAAEYVDAKSVVTKCETTQFADSWYDEHRPIVKEARAKLLGNKLFWWALGFDQMVHHLTHYVCIYFILKLAGAL